MAYTKKPANSRLLRFVTLSVLLALAMPAAAKAEENDVAREMREQLRQTDALAVRIFETSQVQAARARVAAMYRADPKSNNPDTAAAVDSAAGSTAMAASMLLANADPLRPKVQWWNTRAHRWPDGLRVPDSRFGLDNPDNFYTEIPMDGQSHYQIVGQMPEHAPSDMTFSLLSGYYQETDRQNTAGFLRSEDLQVGTGGRFVVTVGPEPAEGRANYIQSTGEARMLQIRQTIGDWNAEEPFAHYVRRMEPAPATDAPAFEEKARRAAELAMTTARAWGIDFPHRIYEKVQANTMTPLFSASRYGGLASQVSSGGRFELAEDEAMIIRTKTYDAAYFSLQLGDQWMVSAEYVYRTGNLNNHQVIADADGMVTFVISPVDPGVYNWADPGAIRNGYIALRLQDVRSGSPDGEPVSEVQLVKLADLREALPESTRFVNPAQRAEQIAQRVSGWERRMTAIMGEAW